MHKFASPESFQSVALFLVHYGVELVILMLYWSTLTSIYTKRDEQPSSYNENIFIHVGKMLIVYYYNQNNPHGWQPEIENDTFLDPLPFS